MLQQVAEVTQVVRVEKCLAAAALDRARLLQVSSLRRVINATGIVIHTNLGRAPMAPEVVDAVASEAGIRYVVSWGDDIEWRKGRRVVDRLVTLPPAWFHERRTGELVGRVAGDVARAVATYAMIWDRKFLLARLPAWLTPAPPRRAHYARLQRRLESDGPWV